MQNSESIPHGWLQGLYLLLATFLGYVLSNGPKWIKEWSARNKPQADIHVSMAQARKIDAETRHLDLESYQLTGNVVLQMVDRLSHAQLRIDQLIRERDEWRLKAEQEAAAKRLSEAQLEALRK